MGTWADIQSRVSLDYIGVLMQEGLMTLEEFKRHMVESQTATIIERSKTAQSKSSNGNEKINLEIFELALEEIDDNFDLFG